MGGDASRLHGSSLRRRPRRRSSRRPLHWRRGITSYRLDVDDAHRHHHPWLRLPGALLRDGCLGHGLRTVSPTPSLGLRRSRPSGRRIRSQAGAHGITRTPRRIGTLLFRSVTLRQGDQTLTRLVRRTFRRLGRKMRGLLRNRAGGRLCRHLQRFARHLRCARYRNVLRAVPSFRLRDGPYFALLSHPFAPSSPRRALVRSLEKDGLNPPARAAAIRQWSPNGRFLAHPLAVRSSQD